MYLRFSKLIITSMLKLFRSSSFHQKLEKALMDIIDGDEAGQDAGIS